MSNISARMDKVLRDLDERKLSRFAYDIFKELTPEKSGNAKRKTQLKGNQIVADYPYAGKLDKGYSQQAPEGMSKPTFEKIKQYVKDNLGIQL